MPHNNNTRQRREGVNPFANMPGETLISALPQNRQNFMTKRWGKFGGGAAMPTTLGAFREARRSFKYTNSQHRPVPRQRTQPSNPTG